MALALCAAIAFAGPANAKPSITPTPIKGPSGDKFYKPPKELPKTHGTLIWSEVQFSYKPTIGYVISGTLTLKDQIYMRPRLSETVVRVTS